MLFALICKLDFGLILDHLLKAQCISYMLSFK